MTTSDFRPFIVVQYPGNLSKEQREEVRKEVQEQVADATVVVLCDGGHLSPLSSLNPNRP